MTIYPELDPMWAELNRLRITPRTFAKLPPGRSGSEKDFAMTIGPTVFEFMKSLPDGIGEDGFIAAFRARFPFPKS